MEGEEKCSYSLLCCLRSRWKFYILRLFPIPTCVHIINEDIPGNVSGRLEKDYQVDHVREIGHVKMEGILEVAFPNTQQPQPFGMRTGKTPFGDFQRVFQQNPARQAMALPMCLGETKQSLDSILRLPETTKISQTGLDSSHHRSPH